MYEEPAIVIKVRGLPAPQGSKRALRNKHSGKVMLVESSKAVAPWRQDVRQAALMEIGRHPDWQVLSGPLALVVTFVLPRPKGHWRTGRNAELLRGSAPAYPHGRPDLSKLVRSTEDALTGVVWGDDAQIVHVKATKIYESEAWPMGATLSVHCAPVTIDELNVMERLAT